MVTTDLPAEILDHIAAALDSPTDLRNLAAVCTRLRLLLSPHHTQFRVIRAPLISPIWKKIAESRLFAKNIRVLEIQSDEVYPLGLSNSRLDKPVIPAIFQGLEVPSVPMLEDDMEVDENGEIEIDLDTYRRYNETKNAMDLDAERILISALKGMSSLTSFRWARTPPLINHNQEDDIWITLAKYCTSLNAIDVFEREKPDEYGMEEDDDDPAYQRPSLNPNFYLFKDLKSFSLYTGSINSGHMTLPDVEKCAEMLVRKCPNLEVLKLENILYADPNIQAVPASPLFSGLPWSNLCELVLFGFDFISTELASCLASNPTIENLSLKSIRLDQPLVLLSGVLPRLKWLSTDYRSTLAHSFLDCNISTPRPLEYLSVSSLDDAFLDSLEHSGSGPNLKTLITVCSDGLTHLISRLSGIAPNLEWLDVSHTRRTFDRSIYPVFSQLPRLRTLRGIRFVDSYCDSASENTESIQALVKACPNLQRISWYRGTILDHSLGVIIERNGSHVAWSLRRRQRGLEIGPVCWFWGEKGWGTFQL